MYILLGLLLRLWKKNHVRKEEWLELSSLEWLTNYSRAPSTLLACPLPSLVLPYHKLCTSATLPSCQGARPVYMTLDRLTVRAVFEFLLAYGLHCPDEFHSYPPGCFEKVSSPSGMGQLWLFRLPRLLCLGNTGGGSCSMKCLNKMLQSALELHFTLQNWVFERHFPFGISTGKDTSNPLWKKAFLKH